MEPARRCLLADDEAIAVEERYGRQRGALDISRRLFAVDRSQAAFVVAYHDFEEVLLAVDTIEIELSRRRPPDAGDILIGIIARRHGLRAACGDVVDMQRDDRVVVAGLGILEAVGAVIQLAVVTHHLKQRHAALVEPQIGHIARVGREGISLRRAVLLLVYPVGRAVYRRVPLAVVRQARGAALCQVEQIQVVVLGIGHRARIGRKGHVAYAVEAGKTATAAVDDRIVARKRMAVYRLAGRGAALGKQLQQCEALVGRERRR